MLMNMSTVFVLEWNVLFLCLYTCNSVSEEYLLSMTMMSNDKFLMFIIYVVAKFDLIPPGNDFVDIDWQCGYPLL